MFYYLGIKPVHENRMVEGEYESYYLKETITYNAHLFIDLTTWGIECINVDDDKEMINSFFDNCITDAQYSILLKPITKGFYYIGDSSGNNGNDVYNVYKNFETGATFEVWNHDVQPSNVNMLTSCGRELRLSEKIERSKKPNQIPFEDFNGTAIFTEKYFTRNQYFEKRNKSK